MALDFRENNFQKEVLEAKMLVVVDFWAPWCPPCRLLKPVIEKLAKNYQDQVKIGQLNIDENPKTTQKFQVMSVPTLIFFKEGKIVARLLGLQPEKTIKEKVEQLR